MNMNFLVSIGNFFRVNILKRHVHGLFEAVDSRNFGAKVIAGAVTIDDLTRKDFNVFLPDVLINQSTSDFCVGASNAYRKQATEGLPMSWAGAFAMAMRSQGYVSSWGTSILEMMKGCQKYGIPENRFWPWTGNRDYCADWKNMSQLVLDNAVKHRDGSFFQIEPMSGWDKFDIFRAYLWKLKDRKIAVQTGADAHAITLVGQVTMDGEIHLFGPDSYGINAPNYGFGRTIDGYRYFTRQEVNQMFTGYIGLDMPRSLAELLVRYDGKAIKKASVNDCYLVKDGQKHFLKNEAIAWSHNTLLFGEDYVFALTEEEFEEIPMGEQATFDSGSNRAIILRILEKVGKTDLINEE